MSTDIIFQTHVFFEAPSHLNEGSYVVAMETGSNNCFDHNNRIARSWSAMMAGTHDEVMEKAAYLAGAFPGGAIRRVRGKTSACSFIKSIRAELENSRTLASMQRGYWSPKVLVPYSDSAFGQINAMGFNAERCQRYSEPHIRADVPPAKKMQIFDLARLFPGVHPSYLFEIYGLPRGE